MFLYQCLSVYLHVYLSICFSTGVYLSTCPGRYQLSILLGFTDIPVLPMSRRKNLKEKLKRTNMASYFQDRRGSQMLLFFSTSQFFLLPKTLIFSQSQIKIFLKVFFLCAFLCSTAYVGLGNKLIRHVTFISPDCPMGNIK